jgi:hypothetical protein
MTGREMMIKEGKFGLLEAICLTTLVIVPKIFFTSPMAITKDLGTAAWYGTLISCITSIIFFMFLYLLMKRFPQKNLVQVFEASLGKILGKTCAIIFCAYFLYYCGVNVREFLGNAQGFYSPVYSPEYHTFYIFIYCSTDCILWPGSSLKTCIHKLFTCYGWAYYYTCACINLLSSGLD